jgi:hypothetical protein
MFEITFKRNGHIHKVSTSDVEKALHGRYGLLTGKTGHLNKIIKIEERVK